MPNSGLKLAMPCDGTYDDDVESTGQDAGHAALAYHGTILFGQVVNEHTEIQVRGLIFRKLGALYGVRRLSTQRQLALTFFDVALLGALCDLVSVHEEFHL